MAVHSIRQMPRAILISLTLRGHASIGIDLRHHTYVWPTPLDEFPTQPGEVLVGTYPIDGDAPGFVGKAQGLDPLLWVIGVNAFGGARASWLRPGDRYRLKRWPDLDVLPHTADQGRAITTIAQGLMTVEKLAAKAGLAVDQAQDVVNALSLMGALHRIEGKNSAPLQPPPGAYDQPARVRGRHVRRGG